MTLSNKVYDALKWITILVLPALGTLYFTIATILELPNGGYAAQVEGIIAAVTAFLGVILRISSSTYKGDGTLQVTVPEDENEPVNYLFLVDDVEGLANKDKLVINVENKSETSID